jgi:hypothetical protein
MWGNWQRFTIKVGRFDGIIPLGEHPDTSALHYWVKYPFAIITVNNGYGKGHCNNRRSPIPRFARGDNTAMVMA